MVHLAMQVADTAWTWPGSHPSATRSTQGRAAHSCRRISRREILTASHAQFVADGVGDGVGVVVHLRLGFGLDHDAGQRLGSGVADDDAAESASAASAAEMAVATAESVQRALLAHMHVDDDLREGLRRRRAGPASCPRDG